MTHGITGDTGLHGHGTHHGPGTKPGTDHLVDAHEGHPGERTYIEVAVILAVITAVEVAVYYIEALEDVLVPILVVLSAIKFAMVVGWFMHLKFDDRRFTWIFLSGLIIAVSAILAVAAMFGYNVYDEFGLNA